MAYTRMDKYKELRDGINDEAKLNRESVKQTEVVDDDFLAFLNKDVSEEVNKEEISKEETSKKVNTNEVNPGISFIEGDARPFDETNTRMDILKKIRGNDEVKAEEKKPVSLLERIAAMSNEEVKEVKDEVTESVQEPIKIEKDSNVDSMIEQIKERDAKEVQKVQGNEENKRKIRTLKDNDTKVKDKKVKDKKVKDKKVKAQKVKTVKEENTKSDMVLNVVIGVLALILIGLCVFIFI